MKKYLEPILGLLVTMAVPVILSTLSILVLLSPAYIQIEYRRAGFPPDRYGFSTAERLEYGNLTRRYLVTRQNLDQLRSLEFDTGDPLYLERELTHLRDVKIVLQGLFLAVGVCAAVLALAGLYSWKADWEKDYLAAVSRGGRLTALALIGILVLTAVSFQALFTNFHLIFFEGDSWLFSYSDTLIRLFPIRFWQDAFFVFGALTLAGGILLGWLLPGGKRKIQS